MASLLAQRLIGQQIARPSLRAPADVVAWLGAVQAQDYAAAKWAIGLRLKEAQPSDGEIEQAIASGAIIRTHALRFTWQLIAPKDVRWILELVAPRLLARYANRHRQLGLDTATLRRSRAAFEKALRGGKELTRPELALALTRAGIATEGQRLAHMLVIAEVEQVICGGARRGKQHTYALLDQRVPAQGRKLARTEALALLARRYFRSRGPASAADFSWWSGLAPSDARAAIAALDSELVAESVAGQTLWRSRDSARSARLPNPTVALLPAFDEYLIGYRDRSAMLDPKNTQRLNAGGGMLGPCVVLGGRVVGGWRRELLRTELAIEIAPFDKLSRGAREKIAAAAERYGAFLGYQATRTSWAR